METWGSWLPADRRAAMATGEPIPDRAEGGVLFADISGFTPLTEALLRAHGPKRGAEEITVHLDRVYDALVGAVDAYGGSVIGFSGDAITCWFGGDDGLRAVAAALEMQRVMPGIASVRVGQADDVALGVKVAVAAGPVRRFQIADPAVQVLDVVAGPTVDTVALVEHLAERGEVVVEAGTAAALGERISIVAERSDAHGETRAVVVDRIAAGAAPARRDPPRDLDAPTQDQVRPWILRTVHDRLASGQGSFLADLRPVVALFVRFTGIDYAADSAESVLDRYVCWAQGVLDRYEGTLVDVTIGDKGSYLAAVVGAPITHADDAARATTAALELSHPPADVAPARTLGIGISRGRMRAGAFGGRTRRTYGVQGADMNLAARLMMHAAEGRIVVSSQVAPGLGERFELRDAGEVRVKGFAEPIATFEVEAARAASTRSPHPADTEIVGREAERSAIAARLEATVRGESGILTVEGEAGIGKSRLVEDLLHEAQDRGLATLSGVAEAIEQATPYHAWRTVFADALDLHDAPADAGAARAWVLERLDDLAPHDGSDGIDLRTLAPLLSAVLPVPIPDTPETEFLTGQSRAERTREVMAAVLRSTAARQPLVVLLDDAQWLDSQSWSLLTRLIGVPEPLLVVIATRPLGDQLPPEIAAVLGAPVTQRLVLEPLPGDAIELLIRQRLGVRSMPDQMVQVIRERAEGNPFFSEELAYALRDRGLVIVRDGRCDLAPDVPDLRQLEFPDTVEGVVTSRIDRLTPSQQTAMKVASVIGRTFSAETLRAVHPNTEQAAHLDEDLGALARLDLTPFDDDGGGRAFRFKHAITHDVAYDMLLFAQRRALHRAVGEHLEGVAPAIGPHLSLLAHHWAEAADDDAVSPEVLARAIGYLGGAGQQAFQAYANVEAVTHLRKQLALLARQPEGMDRDQLELGAHTMLAFSLVQSRGYGDAEVEASYRRAQDLSDRVEDFGPLAFILYGLFSFYASRGEYEPAQVIADRLVALADRQDDQATRSVGLQALAIVALLRGQLQAAHAAARESYAIADRLGDRAFFGFGVDFRLYTSAWLAIAEVLLGLPDQARRTHAISEPAVERQPYARAFVLGFAGIAQLLDDPAATIARADELAALAGRYSFFLFTIISNLYRGWALAATTGDPEVLGLIDGSLPVARFVKLDSFLPWYLGLSADARRRLGRHDEALAAVDEALALTAGAGGSFYEAELHRLRAEIRRAQGAPDDEVDGTLRQAVEVARRQGARWWELRALTSLALRDRPGSAGDGVRDELAALVASFAEGHDTADVIAARAALATHPVSTAS